MLSVKIAVLAFNAEMFYNTAVMKKCSSKEYVLDHIPPNVYSAKLMDSSAAEATCRRFQLTSEEPIKNFHSVLCGFCAHKFSLPNRFSVNRKACYTQLMHSTKANSLVGRYLNVSPSLIYLNAVTQSLLVKMLARAVKSVKGFVCVGRKTLLFSHLCKPKPIVVFVICGGVKSIRFSGPPHQDKRTRIVCEVCSH